MNILLFNNKQEDFQRIGKQKKSREVKRQLYFLETYPLQNVTLIFRERNFPRNDFE